LTLVTVTTSAERCQQWGWQHRQSPAAPGAPPAWSPPTPRRSVNDFVA